MNDKLEFQRNKLLDFFKGLGCIGVVMIHTHISFPWKIGAVVTVLSSFAVPLFFMISGYYAYDEKGEFQSKIKRRAIRILRILIYALIIYALYTVLNMCRRGDLNTWIYKVLNINTFIDAIVFLVFDFVGAVHLWFLLALFYTYILMMLIDKLNMYKLLYGILPLLFLLYIWFGSAGEIGPTNGRIFLFNAVPYFAFGHYVASLRGKIFENCSNQKLGMFIVLDAFLLCLSRAIKCKYNTVMIWVMVYSINIFILGVRNPDKGVCEKIELLGREYSLNVYILHMLVNDCLNFIIYYYALNETEWIKWMFPAILTILTILLSVFVEKVMRKIKKRGL